VQIIFSIYSEPVSLYRTPTLPHCRRKSRVPDGSATAGSEISNNGCDFELWRATAQCVPRGSPGLHPAKPNREVARLIKMLAPRCARPGLQSCAFALLVPKTADGQLFRAKHSAVSTQLLTGSASLRGRCSAHDVWSSRAAASIGSYDVDNCRARLCGPGGQGGVG
jgi:hypothetical protein